jgi:apolipoprotein N-acyltransferase
LLRILLFIIAAAVHALSWIDERFYVAAWAGLVVFFFAISSHSVRRAFFGGFLFGVCALTIAFHWAPKTLAFTFACNPDDAKSLFSFAALVAWEAIPFAFLGTAVALAKQQRIPQWVVPCVWVAMEQLWLKIFPWSFAHTQTDFPAIVQIAELGGVAAVSFVLVYACLDFSLRIERRQFVPTLADSGPLALLLATLLFGFWRLPSIDRASGLAEKLRVGVVQVDPSFVGSPEKMRAASDPMVKSVDLLVWPESTLGTYSTGLTSIKDLERNTDYVREPFIHEEFAAGIGAWLLVGGRSFEPGAAENGPYFQTAFLIDPIGRIVERYHKRVLLPIGEYVPFERWYPWLHDWALVGDYSEAGKSDQTIGFNGHQIGVLICYEDIVADLARRSASNGADVLVCLINGAAFETDAALEQHRRLAMLRSVENRKSLVRCAGTGASCVVSPAGRVMTRLPLYDNGSIVAEAPIMRGQTIYNRVGRFFPHACLAATLGLLCVKTLDAYRRRFMTSA